MYVYFWPKALLIGQMVWHLLWLAELGMWEWFLYLIAYLLRIHYYML